eukprot:TRINITY_DN67866_c2_g2_i4.p1 TRINITY_DN67866_c2_g2~~TRINITY_DN67866_c2_g2_i4.p1  ORF type:complete len:360 (+),score=21.53 TRINITY_DN67866_c2_g2_i4:33-1082(+)
MAANLSFGIFTYNMLASSLGSNTIPWVLEISPEWITRLGGDAAWKSIKATLSEEYKAHFHKNTHTQKDPNKYQTTRRIWAAERIQVIPPEMDQTEIAGEHSIAYYVPDKDKPEEKGKRVVATTMAGLLASELPKLGPELFAHIMSVENTVYNWQIREPRIMKRSLDSGCSVIMLEEYDQHASMYPQFKQAGFEGVFYSGASGESGQGFFWKTDEWETFEPLPSSTLCYDETVGTTFFNPELRENMPALDRRTFGLAKLKHKATGTPVWFGTVHLMTKSREQNKTDVRTGETKYIREILEKHVGDGLLVLAGDFNTTPHESVVFEPFLEMGLNNIFGQGQQVHTGETKYI